MEPLEAIPCHQCIEDFSSYSTRFSFASSCLFVMRLGPLASVLRGAQPTILSGRSAMHITCPENIEKYTILPSQSARLAVCGPQPGATTRLVNIQRCLVRIAIHCSARQAVGILFSAVQRDGVQLLTASSPQGQTPCATRVHPRAQLRSPDPTLQATTRLQGQ